MVEPLIIGTAFLVIVAILRICPWCECDAEDPDWDGWEGDHGEYVESA